MSGIKRQLRRSGGWSQPFKSHQSKAILDEWDHCKTEAIEQGMIPHLQAIGQVDSSHVQ